MKKAKIVIADNEDGKGWFIYRVDYVSDVNELSGKSDFIDDPDIVVGNGVTVQRLPDLEGEERTKIIQIHTTLRGKAAHQFLEIKEATGLENETEVFCAIAADYYKKVFGNAEIKAAGNNV
jgi:hypothetical protein